MYSTNENIKQYIFFILKDISIMNRDLLFAPYVKLSGNRVVELIQQMFLKALLTDTGAVSTSTSPKLLSGNNIC